MKRTHVVLVVVICILLLLFGYLLIFESGTHETQMDITCGRVRHVDHSWLLRRAGKPEETPISELYRKLLGEPPAPKWRPAHGTENLMIRYDCIHGGSLANANSLARLLLTDQGLDDDAKKRIIRTFFDLLLADDDPARASEYVASLWNLEHIDGKHLPDPPKKIEQSDEDEVQP